MKKIPIFDGHCDTIMKDFYKKIDITKSSKSHIDLDKLKKGNIKFQVFAICLNSRAGEFDPLRQILEIIFHIHKRIEEINEFQLVKTYSDIENILDSENKIGVIIAIEGGDLFRGQLHIADILYKLGVRIITLTWNYANSIGTGIWDSDTKSGLTSFGKELIPYLQKLGIIVDISHLSEKCFLDVMKITRKPIVASHSNSYKICNNSRNLKDWQIKAIASSGGIIGINFYTKFLSTSEKATLNDVYRHISYVINLVGDDKVGFGSDFDGIHKTPDNLYNAAYFPKLIDFLSEKKLKLSTIEKICYKNWLRILKKSF